MKPSFALPRLTWLLLVLPLVLLAAETPPPVAATNLPPPLPLAPFRRPVRLRTNESGATFNPARPLPLATNAAGYRPSIHLAPPPTATPVVNNPNALAWDAMLKEYQAKPGETEAKFSFSLTNVSATNVTIESVHTSCGCTAAKLPQQPWLLAPGDHGEIAVTVDLRGKFGTISKSATIASSVGQIMLTVRIAIPAGEPAGRTMGERSRNLQVAAADRQAVFRGECASCHVTPTVGKTGRALFDTACGICHDGQNRATMVPDLRVLNKPTDHAYWRQWITTGREGSLMPAFALSKHGILNDEQIQSLTDYLDGEFRLEVKLPGGIHAAPPAATAQPSLAPKL